MVIAIDIRPLLESEQTGVSVYTKELIDELVKNNNHQFILFYTSWNKEIADVWNRSNVKLRRFRWPNKLFNALQAVFLEPRFDDFIPEADYFLFPNLNFFSIHSKPYGVVVHDISFERYPEFFNLKSRMWHSSLDVRAKLNAAHDIFTVSKYTAGDVAEFYCLPKEKINPHTYEIGVGVNAVYPGIMRNPKSKIRNPLREPEGSSEPRTAKQTPESPYFLFLGRIEERKNVLAIIQAFIKIKEQQKCSGYQLILCGPIDATSVYGRCVLEQIQNKADIKLAGFTNEAEKSNLLANAAALVYPSFYEGFGFPPLEAQAVGVPVVASNVSSLPEVIGQSGLLVDPDRVDELAWAMNEVVTNEATRKLLIARGFENVKRFSWSSTASAILNCIGSLKH